MAQPDKPMTPSEQDLFTAGERRGIERALAAVEKAIGPLASTLGIEEHADLLESLRDAPAGELGRYLYCRTCNRCEGKPFAAGDLCPAHCGGRLVDLNDEPPYDPDATFEDVHQASIDAARDLLMSCFGEGSVPWRCVKDLDDAIMGGLVKCVIDNLPKDRPAPAPPLCRRCGGKREIYGGDMAQLGSGKMIPCPECSAPAAKDAGERKKICASCRHEWAEDSIWCPACNARGWQTRALKVEEERDRLRARVAELESATPPLMK